ncbi:protein-methionine-sulfoxide reductase heme-binding subunit MsrQ [Microbaculum marinum]|uniref:Protein-methionine-sulfoxide reductase heme-binding subunit MsrQ n=1 Tax=Microbaculum marinum TaxID=1764581 RepID=A0AAW9RUK9_9HYPH
MTPWTDRSGKIVPVKLIAFAGSFIPGLLLAASLWLGTLEPKPVTAAIHDTGDWAVRFLLMTLAVSPLRRIGHWPRLIMTRRILGLAALAYAAIHFCLYVVDQKFDLARVAGEIVLRIYLTIGFVALLGLVALGVTSTDAAIRRLGANWQRLHRMVYPIAVLAMIHFFLQSKIDVFQATLMSGFFVLLMIYRAMHARGIALKPLNLAGAALVATIATAAIEFAWYAAATGVDPVLVFEANFDFSYTIRPAWWVGAAGLCTALVGLARSGKAPRRPSRTGRLARETAG